MLASEKVRFVPLIVPAGVCASTKTAVEPAALKVFTVEFRPLTRFVKLVTFVVMPPTVLFTVFRELVLVLTVEVRPFRLDVKFVIDAVWPETVVFKAPTELDNPVKVVPWVVTVELSALNVEFRFDTDVP